MRKTVSPVIGVFAIFSDPIKTVSSVIGVFAATSASPWPWNQVRPPSVITATAIPAHGQRSRT